jgi:hypothetical protein
MRTDPDGPDYPGEQGRPAPSDNYGGEDDDPVVDDQ